MARYIHTARYERKYAIQGTTFFEIENLIRLHPCLFKEVFYARFINNIYFDSEDYKNYYGNADGNMERIKYRIRWYDDLFGHVSKPVLELKIKKGLVGYKDSYKLDSFTFDKKLKWNDIYNAIKSSDIPENIKHEISVLNPTLVNRYKRKYFISANKKFRVTLDKDLSYYSIASKYFNTFSCVNSDDNKIIMEIKYDVEDDVISDSVTEFIPYRVSKNSKYVNGINRLFFETTF